MNENSIATAIQQACSPAPAANRERTPVAIPAPSKIANENSTGT